jgi:hypothetical protein
VQRRCSRRQAATAQQDSRQVTDEQPDGRTAKPERRRGGGERDRAKVGGMGTICVWAAAHGGSSSALGLRQALTRTRHIRPLDDSYSRLRLASWRAALARCLPGFVRAVMRSTRRCTAPAQPALLPCRPAALVLLPCLRPVQAPTSHPRIHALTTHTALWAPLSGLWADHRPLHQQPHARQTRLGQPLLNFHAPTKCPPCRWPER